MWSPGVKVPLSISSAISSSTLRWIARRSGRAPNCGSQPFLGQQRLGGLGNLELHFLRAHLANDFLEFERDDLLDLFARQLMEDDDFVDAVEELRTERLLNFLHHPALHPIVGFDFVLGRELLRAEADVGGRRHSDRADVAGHDDDRVFEVDLTPLRIGQAPVFEHLQQQVEDVGVRLFDLVEQHHASTDGGAPLR